MKGAPEPPEIVAPLSVVARKDQARVRAPASYVVKSSVTSTIPAVVVMTSRKRERIASKSGFLTKTIWK